MPEYEIEMTASYYRYVTVEAPDKTTALSLAIDMVPQPSSDVDGFLNYGNPYGAEVTQGPTDDKGYII